MRTYRVIIRRTDQPDVDAAARATPNGRLTMNVYREAPFGRAARKAVQREIRDVGAQCLHVVGVQELERGGGRFVA